MDLEDAAIWFYQVKVAMMMGVCLNATFKAEEMSVSCSCIHANIQNTSLIQTGLRHSIVKVIWAKMDGCHFDAFLCSKHKSLLQVFCSNKQPDRCFGKPGKQRHVLVQRWNCTGLKDQITPTRRRRESPDRLRWWLLSLCDVLSVWFDLFSLTAGTVTAELAGSEPSAHFYFTHELC